MYRFSRRITASHWLYKLPMFISSFEPRIVSIRLDKRKVISSWNAAMFSTWIYVVSIEDEFNILHNIIYLKKNAIPVADLTVCSDCVFSLFVRWSLLFTRSRDFLTKSAAADKLHYRKPNLFEWLSIFILLYNWIQSIPNTFRSTRQSRKSGYGLYVSIVGRASEYTCRIDFVT